MANYTIFIGNPGTGKSTLLNGIIGKTLFHAGLSAGQGMTTNLQLVEATEGEFYGDTPGLSDIKLREKAAAEISKALKSGEGNYKLVFVVTEEALRVRPVDGVTMKLVLDALPKDRNVPYGIIVNKLSKKRKQKLETDLESFETFVACLNEGREHPSAYIHLYQMVEELEDEDDALHEPTPSLKQFLRMLPSVHIKPEEVNDVRASQFDAQVEKLELMMKKLQEDKDELNEKMEEDRKELMEQMYQMQADHERALAAAKQGSVLDSLLSIMAPFAVPFAAKLLK